MNLTDHLNACAELWAEASGKSVARLSTVVVNDGKFFVRLGTGRLGITTATLEKFADFFADAGSWPEGRIPAEVGEFIHRVAGISPDTVASSDHENGEIGVPPSAGFSAPGYGSARCPAVPLLDDGGSDSLPVPSIEGGREDGETITGTGPGGSFCPTAPLLEGGESLRPTAPLLEGGIYPPGVGMPGVMLVKVGGVALPVICPECDLRIDDARVLQCQQAICPRRIAA